MERRSSNRPVSDVEELIGPFISGVALRTDVSGNPTAAELIRRVHDLAVETRDHIDISFAHVVRELGVSRDPSRTPLYPVMFILLPEDPPSVDQSALFESVPTDPFGLAPFDITLWVVDRAEQLHAYFEYSTVLFDAPAIERMAVHLTNTVAAMVSEPTCRVGSLSLLTEDERGTILSGWNDTATVLDGTPFVHLRFEEQAGRTPEAVAVVFEKSSLTYRELNARANQLAHRLRRLGVSADVLVGVCTERSIELVVALLAILKAGGAYVPLDPCDPPGKTTLSNP